MTCKLENVVADGVVRGDAELIDGVIYATDWRSITLDSFFCDCGEYFNEDELYAHLGIPNPREVRDVGKKV